MTDASNADIPKQVPKKLRRIIRALPLPWCIKCTTNHYVLFVDGEKVATVGNNSSGASSVNKHIKRTTDTIRRFMERRGYK